MPKDLKRLTVFISGPSDVEAEKSAAARSAEEMNDRLETRYGVTLRVITWPDSIRPGVNTDAQAEINRQIGEPDIYVGILAARMGTPTPRYGSGTQEEFEGALARYVHDSKSSRVLFYFKLTVENIDSLDLEQLADVRRFKESLPGRGVVYKDFRRLDELPTLIQKHLDGLIGDEWKDGHWTEVLPSSDPSRDAGASAMRSREGSADPLLAAAQRDNTQDPSSSGDDDDGGILDYLAAAQAAANDLVDSTTKIASATAGVGERITKRTAATDEITDELNRLRNVGGSRDRSHLLVRATETIDGAADDLDQFVAEMTPNVELYRRANRSFFRAHAARIRLGSTVGPTECKSLAQLMDTINKSRASVLKFQSTISAMPSMTRKLRQAQKRAAAIVGEVVAEMSISLDEAQALFEQMGCRAPADETS